MESFSRGQPLAWHTKVVHNDPGCLKTGSMGVEELDCSNDEMIDPRLSVTWDRRLGSIIVDR